MKCVALFPFFIVILESTQPSLIFIIMELKREVLSSESSDRETPEETPVETMRHMMNQSSTGKRNEMGEEKPTKPLYKLQTNSAKLRKTERSKHKKMGEKCIGPTNANPPPQFCNRAGSPWKHDPYLCECEKWPKWLSEAPPELCKSKKTGIAKDGSIIDIAKVHAKEESVAYWRPGGHNMTQNFYYNGLLTNIYEVVVPGRIAPVEVFAIN